MESRNKLSMCRLCLCENECFINIFELNDWQGYVAAEVITDLLHFKVSETDGYPHVVCSECLVKLTDFKKFKECCQRSKVKYDNMLFSRESPEECQPEMPESVTVKAEPIFYSDNEDNISKDIGSDSELCSQDPLREASSHVTIKSEEVIIDSCSYEDSEDPLKETEVSCGPILLKYEVLPFSRESHQQEELIASERSVNQGTVESTAVLMQNPPQDISIVKEVEKEGSMVEGSIQGNKDGSSGSGQEKSIRGEREGLECFHCGIVLTSKHDLVQHMKVHGFVNSYDCAVCGMIFRFNCEFNRHVLTHTRTKPYKCAECSTCFLRKGSLQSHMRIHTGSKPYKCSECSKCFSRNQNLKKHMRRHTGYKPYKCSECSKSFCENGDLKVHMRRHTGFKPYKCSECNKCFIQNGNLHRHMGTHTGYKPYKCPVCSESFSRNSDLKRHMISHTDNKPYDIPKV